MMLERELSGYYLLGVESRPGDRDGESHAISVAVRREDARVRARRSIRVARDAAAPGDDDRVMAMLRSPVTVRELPLRIATYTYLANGRPGMRVLVGAEVGVHSGDRPDLTVGYLLRDPPGEVAWSEHLRVTPRQVRTAAGPVLEVSFPIAVERPGTYALKLAVIDAAGRRGSVEHSLRGAGRGRGSRGRRPLAGGSVIVAGRRDSAIGGSQRGGRAAAGLHGAVRRVGAGLGAHPGSPGRSGRNRGAGIGARGGRHAGRGSRPAPLRDRHRRRCHLPPGRYIARARVMHDAVEVARVRRPFRIVGPPAR